MWSTGLTLAAFAVMAARAEPAQASMVAEIPPDCGTTDELSRELQARLGAEVSLDATRVVLEPEVGGYRLTVEVGGKRRELHDPSCRELLRAAVVIAVALLEPPKPAGPAPPTPAGTASPARESNSLHSPLHFAIGLGAGLHAGTTPKPTLLLDLDGQLKWTHWGMAAGFRFLLPNSERDAANRGVEVSGLGGYVAGLWQPWPRVQARVGVVGYRLEGAGLGSVQQASDVAWELAPTVGARFVPFERPPFWTSLGAEGQLNLLRARFEITNYAQVFQVAPVSGTLFAHAGLSW